MKKIEELLVVDEKEWMERILNRVFTCIYAGKELERVTIENDFDMIKKIAPAANLAVLEYKKSQIVCLAMAKRIHFWRFDNQNISFKYNLDNFFDTTVEYPALAAIVYICWHENIWRRWFLYVDKKPFSPYLAFSSHCPIGMKKYKIDKAKLEQCVKLYNDPDDDKFFSWQLKNTPVWDIKNIQKYRQAVIRNKNFIDEFLQDRNMDILKDIDFVNLPIILLVESFSRNDKELYNFVLGNFNIPVSRLAYIKSYWPETEN